VPALSTRLGDPGAIPYFLWDDPTTVSELEERLRTSSEPERLRLLALILRKARDPDVWRFVTPEEVVRLWPRIAGRLGLRRGFRELLLDRWRRLGPVDLVRDLVDVLSPERAGRRVEGAVGPASSRDGGLAGGVDADSRSAGPRESPERSAGSLRSKSERPIFAVGNGAPGGGPPLEEGA
jgi:hypothetical protein